jgi:RimJ/RimL family protein N-acetyltransferase
MLNLESITDLDYDNILRLTTNLDIMKYIGDSKIWTEDKVRRFIKYCIEDETEKDNQKRNQYYYKIIFKNNTNNNTDYYFIGVIGFHKFPRKELPDYTKNEFYLTVYLDPVFQGKGYFSESIKLLIIKMNQEQPRKHKLYSLVRQSNEKMITISNNKFKFVKEVKLSNEKMNLYLININNMNERKTKKKSSRNSKKNKSKTKKNDFQNRFYFAAAKNITNQRIDELFNHRGNWKKYIPGLTDKNKKNTPKIDFIYVDHQDNIYNKKVQSYPSFIKNFIDDDKHKVGRKNELYQNLGNLVKKDSELSLNNYLLEQHNFDWSVAYKENKIDENVNKVRELFEKNPNRIWIYKPVAGFKGMNIRIFKSFKEFEDYIYDFIKTYSSVWDDPKNKSRMAAQSQWVMQEYVSKPLLFNHKKFHIRPIFLYYKKGNQKLGYILDRILVAHAYEDFKLDDFSNPRIHDTHFASTTTGRIYFQDDFAKLKILKSNEIERIEKQVKDLATYVFDLMNSRCYPENKVCYETFGMDLIIDSTTLTIKLMEVQITNISYGFFDDDKIPGYSNMFEYVLENSLETVVDDYFPPKNKIKKANGFIKFYQGNIK